VNYSQRQKVKKKSGRALCNRSFHFMLILAKRHWKLTISNKYMHKQYVCFVNIVALVEDMPYTVHVSDILEKICGSESTSTSWQSCGSVGVLVGWIGRRMLSGTASGWKADHRCEYKVTVQQPSSTERLTAGRAPVRQCVCPGVRIHSALRRISLEAHTTIHHHQLPLLLQTQLIG